MSHDDFSWNNAYSSGQYKNHWHYSIPSQEIATFLATIPITRGRALDLGCGAGVETMFLAENGFQASGIDISDRAIGLAKSVAKRRRLQVDFRTGTVLNLPYSDGKFMILNDRGCLHNLDLDDWGRYVSEVGRVAKPGAYFLLRGASPRESEERFSVLTEKRIRMYFSNQFEIGVPRQYSMISDAGTLHSMVAVLRRKSPRKKGRSKPD